MTLKEYFSETNLTPSAFAGRINVAPSTILRILAGERSPRLELLQKIADATNGQVMPNDFLNDKDNNEAA